MSTCLICYEPFNKPLCLPCGHLFCTECLVKTVQAIKPSRNFHNCPVCRGTYSIVPVNPSAIPAHLRPFVSPSIRRVYLDSSTAPTDSPSDPLSSASATSSNDNSGSEELVRLRAENQTLRNHCVLWRRRAEVQGAATLGLLDFARMVRDQAVTLAQERDALKDQCRTLKRRLDETVDSSNFRLTGPPSQSASPSNPQSNSWPFTFGCPVGRSSYHTQPGTQTPVDSSRPTAAWIEFQSCIDRASSSSSTFTETSQSSAWSTSQPIGVARLPAYMNHNPPYVTTATPIAGSSAQPPNRMIATMPAMGRPTKRPRPSTSSASTSTPSYPSVPDSKGVPTASSLV